MNTYPPRTQTRDTPSSSLSVSDKTRQLTKQIDFCVTPLSPMLFDVWAQEIADELNVKNEASNKTAQIRRFFDEVVGWEQKLVDESTFRDQEAFFRMLKAKVAYAFGRGRDEKKSKPGLVDDNFRHWFGACIDKTDSPETLKRFRLNFEAVLGFLKAVRG